MYHIRPVSIVPENIDLPKCMYNIKPLNNVNVLSNGSVEGPILSKCVAMDPELQAVADRQHQVIARLTKLHETVNDLINKHGATKGKVEQKPSIVKSSNVVLNSEKNIVVNISVLADATLPSELVIEANPSRPPLSLLFFRHLNPQIRTLCHMHSSCDLAVDSSLKTLFVHDIQSNVKSTIRVVWKNKKVSQLTPPTLANSGIQGEANIARYLSRVLSNTDSVFNYDALSLEELVLVDGVLDSSDLVDSAPDHFLNSLQLYVQKRSNNKRTVADFVGYSTLRYLMKKRSQQSLQKSLIDWMNSMTNEVPSLC